MINITISYWTILLFSLLILNSESDLKYSHSTPLPPNDYKITENGRISFVKATSDNFDRLISVQGKRGKIHYNKTKEIILNEYTKVPKGVLEHVIPLRGRANGQHFRGIRLNFQENFKGAKTVFEFLADHTSVEWSLLSLSIKHQNRSFIYTSFRNDLEYFGSIKVHHILNYPESIDSLKHYHNHPRTPVEVFGKYAFPSNSDLEFRNKVLAKNFLILEFLIRTDGFYVDYTDPNQWNKNNGEDWL